MRTTFTSQLLALLAIVCLCLTAASGQEKGKPSLAPAPKAKSLFKELIPNPTGNNGMEEYLIAADKVEASLFRELSTWESVAFRMRNGDELDKEEREYIAVSNFGSPDKTTVLAARRKAIDGLGDIREIVRSGNGKPIRSLHVDLSGDTTFAELSSLRRLARFLTTEAYVAFANGNSASGTDALIVALTFSNRIPQQTFINRIITATMTSTVLAAFEQHLQRLSVSDIERVLSAVGDSRTWESEFLNAISGEFKWIQSTYNESLNQPVQQFIDAWSLDEWKPLLQKWSNADWNRFLMTAQQESKDRLQLFEKIVRGPESEWLKELKANGFEDSREDQHVPADLEEAANTFAQLYSVSTGIAEIEARYRTQLRLLRIHMLVLAYRWKEGRLPDRLEQVVSASELRDSFGGGAFQYTADAYGNYQLYSKGFGSTGRIDLRYRRDFSRDDEGGLNDPPQMLRKLDLAVTRLRGKS